MRATRHTQRTCTWMFHKCVQNLQCGQFIHRPNHWAVPIAPKLANSLSLHLMGSPTSLSSHSPPPPPPLLVPPPTNHHLLLPSGTPSSLPSPSTFTVATSPEGCSQTPRWSQARCCCSSRQNETCGGCNVRRAALFRKKRWRAAAMDKGERGQATSVTQRRCHQKRPWVSPRPSNPWQNYAILEARLHKVRGNSQAPTSFFFRSRNILIPMTRYREMFYLRPRFFTSAMYIILEFGKCAID